MLSDELAQLESDTAAIAAQQSDWLELREERRAALQELEIATSVSMLEAYIGGT